MFEIKIDISSVVEQYVILEADIQAYRDFLLTRITDEYLFRWEQLVTENLNSSRQEYLKAIQVEKEGDSAVIFRLNPSESELALKIEEGSAPFDLKEGFAQSAKRKISKGGGWYLDVPFRFATSEALAESSAFSGKLPAQVEKIAKSIEKKEGRKYLVAKDLPKEYQKLKVRPTIERGKIKIDQYQHKASIYAGLQRREVGTQKKSSGSYMTFRRVSENSDPLSWIHKGFEPLNLMDKTLMEINFDTLTEAVAREFFK